MPDLPDFPPPGMAYITCSCGGSCLDDDADDIHECTRCGKRYQVVEAPALSTIAKIIAMRVDSNQPPRAFTGDPVTDAVDELERSRIKPTTELTLLFEGAPSEGLSREMRVVLSNA